MSTFSGPQGKGAMRRHREILRDEAGERRAAYDRRVEWFAGERGIRDLDEARATMRREHREDYQTNAEIVDAFLGGEPLRCVVVDAGAEEKYLTRRGHPVRLLTIVADAEKYLPGGGGAS